MTDLIRVQPEGTFNSKSYAQAVRVGGLLFVSGQVAIDGSGQLVGATNFVEQAEQVFKNLKAVLDSAGATFDDVVKVTNFLVRAEDFTAFTEIRARYLKAQPASSTVFVAALVRPELLIEIEAVVAIA